ncbi:MAG TPA: S8 family serine peptidase [Gemmataceae bacterium]|nr:S8 family serine peptidase [Gemmataceae bacterium]
MEERTLFDAGPLPPPPGFDAVVIEGEYDPSAILVRFRPEAAAAGPLTAAAGTQLGEEIAPLLVPGLRMVRLQQGTTVAQALAAYRRDPLVDYAEVNSVVEVQVIPNDPQFGSLWGLHNANDADIDAPEAWDVHTGSRRMAVAVIDTGINYLHPDLYLNGWINQREIPPAILANLTDVDGDGLITFFDLNNSANQGPGKVVDTNGNSLIDGADLLASVSAGGWADGIDADGNNFVDDLIGARFLGGSFSNNPLDDHGHGTHVAGTIGAIGNNRTGVTGINWAVQLVPLKGLNSNGRGFSSDLIACLNYAVAQGVRVSNNSYGGSNFSQSFFNALTAARNAGHLFVAAAGNSGANADINPLYPAAYDVDNIISVAASDANDNRSGFSNYGRTSVDLAAPGEGILSTYQGSYAWLSGTSMATPHVAGVAGLVWSLHPEWTYAQVRGQILSTVDVKPQWQGLSVTGGRLNARRALTGPLRVTTLTPTAGGFHVQFNQPIDTGTLNLYDSDTARLGPADVVLTGAATGRGRGSLLMDASGAGFTFLRTGSVLTPDTYTVTLRSADNGFRSTIGDRLDGNGDGTPGDDYVTTFTVDPSPAVVVGVPDFAVGPGQPVPPGDMAGLPVRLSDGNGVMSVTLTVSSDARRLVLTGASVGPGAPPGSTVTIHTAGPEALAMTFRSPTPLPPGPVDFLLISGRVPDTAPYASKQVLTVTGLQINDGAIPTVGDDGLHVVAYPGDASGNAGYSSADAVRMLRVAVGLDSGFDAFQLADPAVVADVTGNGILNSADAIRVLQEAVGIDRPEVPPLPGVLSALVPGGPDPLLSLPTDIRGRPGDLVTVPVNLDLSDGLESADLALSYDTSRLEVLSAADVRRGRLTADFDLFLVNLDNVAGTIRVGLGRSAGPIIGRGAGSVLEVIFRIRTDAPPGRAIVNLHADLAPTRTQLNEGGLVLIPAPRNEAGDVLDGLITVRGRRPAATQDGNAKERLIRRERQLGVSGQLTPAGRGAAGSTGPLTPAARFADASRLLRQRFPPRPAPPSPSPAAAVRETDGPMVADKRPLAGRSARRVHRTEAADDSNRPIARRQTGIAECEALDGFFRQLGSDPAGLRWPAICSLPR